MARRQADMDNPSINSGHSADQTDPEPLRRIFFIISANPCNPRAIYDVYELIRLISFNYDKPKYDNSVA